MAINLPELPYLTLQSFTSNLLLFPRKTHYLSASPAKHTVKIMYICFIVWLDKNGLSNSWNGRKK